MTRSLLPDLQFFEAAEDYTNIIVRVSYRNGGGSKSFHVCNGVPELATLMFSLPKQAKVEIADANAIDWETRECVYMPDAAGKFTSGSY